MTAGNGAGRRTPGDELAVPCTALPDRTRPGQLRLELDAEAALRRAVEDGELVLHYQPIRALATGEVVAVEALARWAHPLLGARAPADFIPLAERTGLIVPLGAWVLEEAAAQLARWRAEGAADLVVSVNLSAVQLSHQELVHQVLALLDRHSLAPGSLWLEVTETAVMHDVETSQATLAGLAAGGARVVLDDFGTGHSTLAYLAALPASVVKLDHAFVSWFDERPDATKVVAGVVELARSLGKDVVAEGVETSRHLEELRRLGCELGQGWLLGRPAPADVVGELVVPAMVAGG